MTDLNKPLKIACIGEAMIELAFDGNIPLLSFAGDVLNTAIYLRRNLPLDYSISFVSVVGSDELSQRMLDFINTHGVSNRYVSKHPSLLPGLYAINTTFDGERSFLYWRENSAARTLFSNGFDVLNNFDVIYFSAITLAILPEAVRDRFLMWLSNCDKRIIFDSNYRPKLWTSIVTARHYVEAAWRLTEIGLPSLDDEIALFGDRCEEDVILRLNTWGVNLGALKRGALGPRAIGKMIMAPPVFQKANLVADTTAAGDSFNGAFLGSYIQHHNTADALGEGHRCSLAVIAKKGAIIPLE